MLHPSTLQSKFAGTYCWDRDYRTIISSIKDRYDVNIYSCYCKNGFVCGIGMVCCRRISLGTICHTV